MATINSKIEGVDVLGVVTAGETIYVGRATSTQHGIVKPAATDFEFDSQTNAMLIKLGVGLKRTDDGIAIAIYDGNVVTDVLAVEDGLEIKYADIDEETENSKIIPWSEFTTAEIAYIKEHIGDWINIEPGTGEGAVQQIGVKATGPHSAAFGFGTVAGSDYETVVGQYNVERTDTLFQVGNGTDANNRNDAFTVYNDGRAEVDSAPTTEKGVLRLADLGENIVFPYGEHSVTYDTTDGITVTGTMRIYIKKTDSDSTSVYHDVENVSMSVPLVAGDNVTIDADETNKTAIVKVLDMSPYGVDIGVGLPASATNGTLTAEQLALLQSSENNYIMFQHEKYYLEDKGHVEGYITYTHTGYENSTYWIKSITITVSTRAWVLNKGGLAGKGLGFDTDGKLQVKAGANLSFGEDGTLNAVGSQGSEYANTSEIVDNAITLTSASTLDDLVTQILAQKTKVVRVPWSDNLARLLGTPPELTGPPISQYNVLFKTIYTGNQALISAICIYESRIEVGAESFIGAAQDASAQYSGWRKLNNYYPIGSIYMSTVENNYPSLLFGGTWEQIKDVFLLAAGDTYSAGSTGGSADAVVVLHDHIEYGTNTGGAEDYRMAYISETGTDYGVYYEPDGATVGSKGVFVRTADAGVNGTGKNMPPYLAVYMWRRVA